MRLVMILTLGLGVCGPLSNDAEKVVFVVPRYVRRSFSAAPFYGHRSHGFKSRPSKRPYFAGSHGPSQANIGPFFPGENHRVPHGDGDDFNEHFIAPPNRHRVNHVVIPHGEGISHGISFGKGYIPREEFKAGGPGHEEFYPENGNDVDYNAARNQQAEVNFEDEVYQRFQSEDQTPGPRNMDWPFPPHEPRYAPASYDQESNQEEAKLEVQAAYESQVRSPEPKEEIFYPKGTGGEENPAPHGGVPAGPPPVVVDRKPEPIVLRDTIDMTEYIRKVEDFAKSWPPAAGLQGFGWKNQILNPPALNLPNYQGFNSWTANLPRTPTTGSYQVKEESVEEPSRRSFRTVPTM